MVDRAEQDGEYLHETHCIIAEALANGGSVEDELDAATAVLDALAGAGWHLLNAVDAERAIGAWVLKEVRYGHAVPVDGGDSTTGESSEAAGFLTRLVKEGQVWCAYVNGYLVAAGPDKAIIEAAWKFHLDGGGEGSERE